MKSGIHAAVNLINPLMFIKWNYLVIMVKLGSGHGTRMSRKEWVVVKRAWLFRRTS
jgi:hypothetical protein